MKKAEEDASTFPAIWIPDKPGEYVLGKVIKIEESTDRWGNEFKILHVEQKNGEVVAVFANRVMLARKIEEAIANGLKEGDEIAIFYKGKGKRAHIYGVAWKPAGGEIKVSPKPKPKPKPAPKPELKVDVSELKKYCEALLTFYDRLPLDEFNHYINEVKGMGIPKDKLADAAKLAGLKVVEENGVIYVTK